MMYFEIPLEQIIGGLLLALGASGGSVHFIHRRRANGHADSPAEEVLRQKIHDQRHGETLRILKDVTETTSNAAVCSKQAAEASTRSAEMTAKMAITLDERLPRKT